MLSLKCCYSLRQRERTNLICDVSSSTTAGHLFFTSLPPPDRNAHGCFSFLLLFEELETGGGWFLSSAHSSFIRCFYFPVTSEFCILLALVRSLSLYSLSLLGWCLHLLIPICFHASIFIFTRIWSMLFANSCLIMLLLAKMKSWGYFVAFDACGWGCFDKASRLLTWEKQKGKRWNISVKLNPSLIQQ